MNKKRILMWSGIAVIGLLCLGGLRLVIGWRPFSNLQSEDLYYVGRISLQEPKLLFLDGDDIENFTDLMRGLRVFPTSQKWNMMDGLNQHWFVFEYENQKGEMILIKLWRLRTGSGTGDMEHWVTVNDKIYRIKEKTYEQFDLFLNSYKP